MKRRIFSILMTLALVTSLVVFATPVAAATITVDVNGGADYTTITEALAAASEGDTIVVCPGTYDTDSGETFPLDLDLANLTIKSLDGAAVTFITPDSGDLGAFEVTAAGVTIGGSGFTITSGGRAGIYALPAGGNGITVQDCIFRSYSGGESRGMWFEGLSNGALITGNSFTSPRVGTGILVKDADGTTISNNTVAAGMIKYCFLTFVAEEFDPAKHPAMPYAEYVATTPSVIDNVSVTGNSVTGDATLGPRWGVRVATATKPHDHGLPCAQDLTVGTGGLNINGCNTFTSLSDFAIGIDEDEASSSTSPCTGVVAHILGEENIHINNNNFVGNTVAVENGQPTELDAVDNWWNDVTGAGPCGGGEPVVGFVDTCPWLNAPCPDGTSIYPILDVDITQAPTEVAVTTNFAVTATVQNTSSVTAKSVTVQLVITGVTGTASLVGGELIYNVGDISPGSTQEVNWTVHCDSLGTVSLQVKARETECRCDDEFASTSVVVDQVGECLLTLVIDDSLVPEVCRCEDFTVTGTVTNTGDFPITGATANLTITSDPTEASITSTNPFVVGDLDPGQSVPVTWTVHCDGRDISPCTNPDYVDLEAFVSGTCQGSPITSNTVTKDEYINQKYMKVTIVSAPSPANPIPGMLNVCQEFYVDALIKNCHTDTVTGVVVTLSIADPNAELYPEGDPSPPAMQEIGSIGPGETVRVSDIAYAWHLHCTDPGDAVITVEAHGITEPLSQITICDDDTITVIQQAEANLTVTLDAPTCAGYCEDFTVTANIANTGGATATDLVATLEVLSGEVTLSAGPLEQSVLDIAGSGNRDVHWVFHCSGDADATFRVTVTGTDSNSGADITETTLTDTDGTEQVYIDVVITTPEDGTTYSTSTTFCVTAEITNNELATVDVFSATINTGATASLVVGETAEKTVGEIPAGGTDQISWTLHCDGSGDSTITVTATMLDPCEGLEFADSITVHQEQRAALELVILSPFDYSYVATSQDFAVTAEVTNTGVAAADGVAITLTPDANATVTNPTETVTIAGGASVVLTWTVHCDASGDVVDEVGDTLLTVTAVGTDENSGDEVAATEQSVIVTQYAAAHLEVEITDISSSTIYVGDEFVVSYTVINTGESDAWEVSAVLSVEPAGTARVAEGMGGYTQTIGTLAGHGQYGDYTGSFTLQCKEVCTTTITITAEGFDEKGYHFKQVYLYDQWVDPICQWIEDTPGDGPGWVCIEGYWLEGGGWVLCLEPEPGRAIDARFIEPDSETVKQLEVPLPPTDADLAVEKEACSENVTMRELVTFTITVTNNGPADATGVRVTDVLPTGLNYENSTGDGWYDVTSGVWSIGDLADAATATLTITATVNTVGEICNVASVTADQPDPTTTNNSDLVCITGEEQDPDECVGLTGGVAPGGFNLISLPLIPASDNITKWLADAGVSDNVSVVAYFTGGPTGVWVYYWPGDPEFSDFTTIEDGKGYFIQTNETTTICYDGYEISAPPPAVPPFYDMVMGWNLFGFKSTVPKLPAGYLAAIDGSFTVVYGYANGGYFIVGSPGHEYLQPGLGYWIAMTIAGTIYP